MTYRVEVHKGKDGYYVRLVHVNGNTVLDSEAYSSHWNARRAGRKIARTFQTEYREIT